MELPAEVQEGAEEVNRKGKMTLRMMMMLMMVMTMGMKRITMMMFKVALPTGMCCTQQTAMVPSRCLDSTTSCRPCWKSSGPAG